MSQLPAATEDLAHLRELKAQATTNGTQRDYERWMAFAKFLRAKFLRPILVWRDCDACDEHDQEVECHGDTMVGGE